MEDNIENEIIERRNEFLVIDLSQIQLSISLIGIFFYITIVILFFFYYDLSFFIKEEIFSFIFVKSISSFIVIFIDDELYKAIISYISQVISFILILIHINKCITQKKIVDNIKDLKIMDKAYIIFIYMLCFFPIESFIQLQIYEILFINITRVILTILFYYHINKKIRLLLERLKQQKMKSKNDVDNLIGNKEIYYIKMIKTINSMYFKAFILFILYIIAKAYLIYNSNEIINFFTKFFYFFSIIFIILAELLFFFCSNRIELEKGFRNEKFKNNLNKFKIINQEDSDVDEHNNLNE